jgi:glycosyltransferase involved in cell wall biosynthesis
MRTIYNESDIVVLPSYREGLPKVLLEAAAFSLPIVTTDVPGCREIVKDNCNGFIVEKKAVKSLSVAIETLVLDKNLRAEFGKNGRGRIEKEFSLNKISQEIINLYNKI